MSSELPNQPDEPADRPAAQALPPPAPLPGQAEAADWTPQDWRPPPSAPATTEVAAGTDPEQIPSYGSAPEAKPPLDTVSLIALITAIPSLGLVSIPLGIWGVIRTKNKQRRGRILAVISFVLIGLWAIVGTVVGVMAGLPTTVQDRRARTQWPGGPGHRPGHRVAGAGHRVADAGRSLEDEDPGASAARAAAQGEEGVLGPFEDRVLHQGHEREKYTTTAIWVDCRSRHQAEVTGTFNLRRGSRYPGDKAVEKASDARCKKYFARYVGIDWDSSAYDYDYVTPDPSEWRQGNREVICLAEDPDHPENNRISLRKVKQ